ncbi:outer membrane protein [Xanthobacter autotrophicus DSM 431]|uniref:outer membrane protein n=1 Tax=Xanthobacter nonsaccharivorans TaxID=3119912 RepID=UPI003728C1CA
MKKRLLVLNVLGAVALAGAAQAADLATKPMVTKAPVAPAFSWTGFYIGANAGYGWGQTTFSNSYDPLNPSTLVNADADFGTDGAVVGGQIGYNWQINQVVLGVEADAAWSDISGSGSYFNGVASSCVQSNDACTAKTEAFGTIAARLGVAFDRVLVYAKGGAAWAVTKYTAGNTDFVTPAFSYQASVDETRWGWTIGGGVEWAFTNNWSAKVEYNYMDFGSSDVTFNFVPNTFIHPYAATVGQSLQVLKGGVNYRF